MKNFLNYENAVHNLASREYKLHKVSKEWKIIILSLVLAKVGTNLISMYAGYSLVYHYIYQLLNHAAATVAASVVVLLIIELLTVNYLKKSVKFILRGDLKTAIFPTVLATGLFILSFHLSTNGLALKRSEKADNTEAITNNFTTQKEQTELRYNAQIEAINKRITTIEANPQGWANGKRTILLAPQLKQIDEYYKQISALQNELKKELQTIMDKQKHEINQNTATMQSEAEKYYKAVAFIMFFQLFSNTMLMYFWSRIYTEQQKEQLTAETVQAIAADIDNNIFSLLVEKLNSTFLSIDTALKFQLQHTAFGQNAITAQAEPTATNNANTQPNETKPYSPQTERKIGFVSAHENTVNTPEPSKRPVNTNENETDQKIKYLAKHKLIVKSIKNTVKPPQESLSNNEIRIIQQQAKKAPQKSFTLVRKVFEVCQAIGLQNIDENGNIINK